MRSTRRISPAAWIVGVALLILACVAARAVYQGIRELVVAWRVPGLEESTAFQPGQPFSPESSVQGLQAQGIDATAPMQNGGPPPVPWDGSSRVTVLLMGLDYREWEDGGGPARTDTLILFTFDPQTLSAGMLSIPRDLWVNIPDYGYGKINTAYTLGVLNDAPGGGPGHTLETVEQFLGIDIPYYAQVDFNAFVRFIDEIDGVKLEVPEEISVDPIGPESPIKLQPGIQVLSGELALAYARARNTPGGDFDRAQRQQQVILGIRDRIISFDMLPILITKAPVLYNELVAGVHTNLTLEQMIRMGLVAQRIPLDSIARLSIGYDNVTYDNSPEGLFILQPNMDQIRGLRDELFDSAAIISPVVENRPLEELVAEEAASVAVLNATSVPGLASRTTTYLTGEGLNVTITGNAAQGYDFTTVIDYTGSPYTLRYLIEVMGIDPAHIFHSYDPEAEIDVEINLGLDWVENNPMPPENSTTTP